MTIMSQESESFIGHSNGSLEEKIDLILFFMGGMAKKQEIFDKLSPTSRPSQSPRRPPSHP
jgi:hypothetical protein